MLKSLIIFGITKQNLYTFAKLIALCEHDSEIQDKYDMKIFRITKLNSGFFKEIKDSCEIEKRPSVIIPITLFTAQFDSALRVLKVEIPALKQLNPNVLIFLGGWHATGNPFNIPYDLFDIVFLGEAEDSFPLILRQLAMFSKNNTLSDFKSLLKSQIDENKINHIAIQYKNEIKLRDQKQNSDLCDINKCPSFSERYRVFSPIEISRGCPFRCKFCQIGNYWNYMRHANPDTIIQWVKKAIEIKYKRVWFLSPNSFAYGSPQGTRTNPNAVGYLLKGLRNLSPTVELYFGTFPSEVRPEFVTREMMEIVRPYINNKYFTVGAQSASNELLKRIKRGHSFEDVKNAIDIITDYDFGVDVDFIFGLPEENQDDVDLTIDYFNEVLKSTKKIRIHAHTFMPLPGTPYEHVNTGRLTPEIKEIVGKLESAGKSFGHYLKQSKIH